MRRPLIAGNWKMYKTPAEAAAFAAAFREAAAGFAGTAEVALCPAFPALVDVSRALAGSGIALGAQNMFWAPEGAYTGEVSAAMLRDAGCRYVILGHSERRQYFGETDEGVNRKAAVALENGLIPIVCVGETLEQREAGVTENVVTGQVRGCLAEFGGVKIAGLVIAYEPVWAIGTGRTASEKDAQEVIGLIRRTVEELSGAQAAAAVRILYGGSVKPENTAGLMRQPDIDGALVGGASLDPAVFARIVGAAEEVYRP
ncbi:MAG: triose-phosphate isomerase [Thermoanaerobacterales bacterium]|nr:triose-phosphate isomerase [Thermoanaerobacterales bacterium]